jgi:hypothetical protein
VPFAFVHDVRQPAQLVVEVSLLVSHPFDGSASQLAYPELQTGLHAPAEQLVVPFAFAHALPHAPQLEPSLRVSISQPFAGFASQFWKPAEQAPSVHTPETHVSAAFGKLHAAPQLPQSVSVEMLFSQPLTGFASQLA